MELAKSKTAINLMSAFAGESQARNRYTFFASAARTEGYVQIANIFEETANQEKEHAKRLFKFMTGGTSVIIPGSDFPFGTIGKTVENLRASAAGEHHEWEIMYPEFAKIADEEGFTEIATVLRAIAVAEKQHEKRYLDLMNNIEKGIVFKRDKKVVWRCQNCGYLHEGLEAPQKCIVCDHPRMFFEILVENW